MRQYIFILTMLPFLSFTQVSDTVHLQSTDTILVQLSGVVIAEETLEPAPYTAVYDKTQGRGVISDYYGFFSLVVVPGDTLYFRYMGYQTSSYIVPDSLTDDHYSIIHMLESDTLQLPEVEVYPWPSREQFAERFLNMDPYDDAIRRAQRDLSGESLAFIAARVETDATTAFAYSRNQMNTMLYTRGMLPANNLLNPYAWAKLIQDWKAGKLKKQ